MPERFPFNRDVEKYSRHLWNKDTYLALAHFFSEAQFDPNVVPVAGWSIWDYLNASGSNDFRLPCGGGGSSTYASYFRVIDASQSDETGAPINCRIGVTNGSAALLDPIGNCGTVKINGVRVDVAAIYKQIQTTSELPGQGEFYVWLHMWISAEDGEQAEIIVGDADDDTPPDNPNGGLIYGSQLIGRVVVTGVDPKFITAITQDYLRGGEHSEILWGDCTGESIGAPAP